MRNLQRSASSTGMGRYRRPALCSVSFLLAIGVTLACTFQARADDGITVFKVTQQDVDQDGDPDLTTINCSFVTPNDKVTILDQGDDMAWSQDWEAATDFENDSWIFDAQGDGLAELIVVFGHKDGDQSAYFYDDQNGDGHVAYELVGTILRITEGRHWSLGVETTGGWFQPDGTLNLNLTFLLDGPSPVLWFWTESTRNWLLKLDGEPDWQCTVVNANLDSAPESEVCTCLALTPPGSLSRAWVEVNAGAHRSLPLPDPIFWPFLGSVESLPTPHNYFDFVPNISVDWSQATIMQAFVTGYPIETGFHIQSWESFVSGQINNADFENPQAYYDLANDGDNRPELHIRMHHLNADTSIVPGSKLRTPINEIRYSWNQNNTPNLHWDYKIGLAGRQTIDAVIDIQGFLLKSIPYSELPAWVTSQTWDYATFVANEEWEGQSSEGIYAWAPVFYANLYNGQPLFEDNQIFDPEAVRVFPLHYTGLTDQPLAPFFNDILPGLRGEYCFSLNGQAYLYYSSIDGRLHLLGAQKGIWNLADVGGLIEYENIDQDDYIDQWNYWLNGELFKSLTVSHSWLVLGTRNEIMISRVDVPESLFVTLPPATFEEWDALGERLEANRRDLDPRDFEALITQFDEPMTHIKGATLQDFRSTDKGFRFVLELLPGFQMTEGEDWLMVQGLAPGEYAVTYDGTFHVQPLTLAQPVLVPGSLRAEGGVIALYPMRIVATLQNAGLEDTGVISACLHVAQPNGEGEVASEKEAALLAGEETQVSFTWTPPMAGRWEAWLTIDDGEVEQSLTMDRFIIEVVPAPQPNFRWALERVGVAGGAWAILGLGIGLAVIAIVLFSLALRFLVKGS
jgi:hypothetical protein